MSRPKVLALIMAGGPGSRLEVLTDRRAKPAMPYAAVYRLIDFPLSNCMNSRIENVWIVQQYQPHSLTDHVSNGRPWDLDRTYGGLRLLQPHLGTDESGWHRGNADAIYRNKSFIAEFSPDLLLVLSADHVYKLDYARVIEAHLDSSAEVTMVTTRVPRAEASRFGCVEATEDGKVTGFAYKPQDPPTDLVTTEVFVFDARTAMSTLGDIAESKSEAGSEGDRESESLEDFGHELLPRFVERGHAYEYRLSGYWRDLGTVESYWLAHTDLLGDKPAIDLDDPDWPIHTLGVQRPPAKVFGSAVIDDSLISSGCEVRGRVVRSVIAPGVVVERGAVVRDSIVLHGSRIGAEAALDCCVIDMRSDIGRRCRMGRGRAPDNASDISGDDLVLVGEGAHIAAETVVGAGARIEPGG
jgi:glucose-1-phosphate adenylyltransferase